jgi:hypothetical protein
MGQRGGVYRVLMRRPEGKRPHGRFGVGGKMILKWIFRKWNRGMDCIDLVQDWGR